MPLSKNPFRTVAAALILLSALSDSVPAMAQPPKKGDRGPGASAPPVTQKVAEFTAGMESRSGLLPIHVDRKAGRVWLVVPAAKAGSDEIGTYLYADTLRTGLGSNPVGLDRGQLGAVLVIKVRRIGNRVLIEQPNLGFRALSDNLDEIAAVRESFATSVIWAGEIAAVDPDGRAMVDLTGFLTRDAHDVVSQLRRAEQGNWQLDPERSLVDLDSCLVFPENVEIDSILTYSSSDPGRLVNQTAPYTGVMTLVQHHSFVKLPDAGYQPRPYDPRAGSFSVDFLDFAVPLDAPLATRWIARHRLEKVDPTAARSKVKKPIVYYVDSGAPEPVRSALVEGAGWWAEAFDKAGFIDAFKVEVLPPNISAMDVRYNVIQWVHRSTRGWSYGGGIFDPRTGEVLKGRVILGSQRVRQDRLIFEGLAGTEKTGTGAPDDPIQLSLQRIRQLAAHEVGHALGLNHNFAASTYGRASVMDYPAPLVEPKPDGSLDFSKAYGVGVGAWDVFAIRYAYGQPAPGTSPDALAATQDALVREAIANGLHFLADQDARPPGGANPRGVLWDNGPDPVAGLRNTLAVRRIALERFGEHNLAKGQPLALLQEVLVPVYLHHRYQLDGALKVVGGLDYTYAVNGDGQRPAKPVSADRQREALKTILQILSPESLDIPEKVAELLLPRPAGYEAHAEMFPSHAAPVFDPLAAAAVAADQVVDGLLQPERAQRLVDFNRRDPKLPGLEEVLDALVGASFDAPKGEDARRAELRRTVQSVTVRRLIGLSGHPNASPAVRARAEGELRALRERLDPSRSAPRDAPRDPETMQRAFLAGEIGRHLDRPESAETRLPDPPEAPPGQPIGSTEDVGLSGCSWGG